MKQPLVCIALFVTLLLPAMLAQNANSADVPPIQPVPAQSAAVWVVQLSDTINPGSAQYLQNALEGAARQNAPLIIIALNTPGGLVDSMRQMVQAIMSSPVPVVVYVSPAGAHAASAGAFIMLAAPVAAMAPATNVGAAHPVSGSGGNVEGHMADKITNDLAALVASLAKQHGRNSELAMSLVTESKSLDAHEALQQGLCDIVAKDLGDLLAQLEGRKVKLSSGEKLLSSQGHAIYFHQPSMRDNLLSMLANPSLAYILFMIGLAGIYFELTNPGAIFPGVVGGLCLIIALFAMSTLSVSVTGLLLIGLALLLFVLELKVASHGLLSIGGVVALFLGSFMLFNTDDLGLGLSWKVMLPTLLLISGFFFAVAFLAGRAQLARPVTGAEALLGASATVIGPGLVRVMGEIWHADTTNLNTGDAAQVEAVKGLTLTLKK